MSGEDRAKLDFTIAALESDDPFDGQADVHPDLRAALEWHASRSPRQVWYEREKIMTDLEAEAAAYWYTFSAAPWRPSSLSFFFVSGKVEIASAGCSVRAPARGNAFSLVTLVVVVASFVFCQESCEDG